MSDAARVVAEGASGRLPPHSLIGNRFRIEGFITAEGGTEVYQAADAQTGNEVALRLVWASNAAAIIAGGKADLERLRTISHKNVSGLVSYGFEGEVLYIASEPEEGHTLRQLIDAKAKEGQTVGLTYAHTLLGHVASGLSEAHKAGAHGGLNPACIWVSRAGRVRIAEMGLSGMLPALGDRGGPAGAPPGVYRAPEVAQRSPLSPAADVYSMGAILFELLTGTPPVPGKSLRGTLDAQGTNAGPLESVISKAMAGNPALRYARPQALIDALGDGKTVPTEGTRITLGKSFDVAQAAGMGDEDQRWLIHKDRLDFGPFSMAQVRAQLERGAFGGHDTIVDSDSGERMQIKDHPELGSFAVSTERKLEAARRQQAEHAHDHTERRKSRAMIIIVGVLLAALGAGSFVYLKNRKAAQEDVLASRVAEADIDAFIKTVKFDFDQKKRPPRRNGGGGGGGKNDPFSGNQNLGDVTKNGGDEVLSDNVIQKIMMGHYRSLVPCIMEERRRNPGLSDIDIEFVILGSGKLSAVRVNGQRNGGFPSCVLGRMQSFGFPFPAQWDPKLGIHVT